MILVAYWFPGKDQSEDPDLLYWATTGSPATLNDYRQHSDGTHTIIVNPDSSVQMVMLLGLSARVFYNSVKGHWIVQPGGMVIDLEVEDPLADDWALLSEMSTLPLFYRMHIVRDELV